MRAVEPGMHFGDCCLDRGLNPTPPLVLAGGGKGGRGGVKGEKGGVGGLGVSQVTVAGTLGVRPLFQERTSVQRGSKGTPFAPPPLPLTLPLPLPLALSLSQHPQRLSLY